jgi:hypothetical protein
LAQIGVDQIGRGEGALSRLRMPVNALGRIDQRLFFIVQHARRHLQQMASTEAEFNVRAST